MLMTLLIPDTVAHQVRTRRNKKYDFFLVENTSKAVSLAVWFAKSMPFHAA